jgi:hypothetical protein
MPATRSQADAVAGGAEPEVADLLEDATAELSAESAARKAAEERVRALEARLAAAGRRTPRRRGSFLRRNRRKGGSPLCSRLSRRRTHSDMTQW